MKGGKRNGAGRKPCTDKKQQFTIYVLTSQIEKLGKDAIRQVCEKAINRAVLKQHITAAVWAVGGLNAPPYQFSINLINITNDE